MNIYFDNAASTPIDPEVLEAMVECLRQSSGNPSSIHTHGREARVLIERARKQVAKLMGTSPSEIFFTSGGTEADNTVLLSACLNLHRSHIITSAIEHHAVLHTAQYLEKRHGIPVHYVHLLEDGSVDLDSLEDLLKKYPNAIVSLMEANNEIGNLLDVSVAGTLARSHGALFHSDTVQTVGHKKHDLKNTPVDFIVASAHKFHGPKGVGFLYMNAEHPLPPLLHGGSQERNVRGGTENVAGIVGLAIALEKAITNLERDRAHITLLKQTLHRGLQETLGDILCNGTSGDPEKSLYTILSVGMPPSEDNELLLFNLDIEKISVSAGSACTSGTNIGSHVLQAIGAPENRGHLRFSFSRMNTLEEVQQAIQTMNQIFSQQ
ncbi:MAG: cysteine desulfurase [Cytophagaceae bacterium]|jgi:cysteine desulfurase|nr:cysteine desulfurase [Cytophagaceae bacterium]